MAWGLIQSLRQRRRQPVLDPGISLERGGEGKPDISTGIVGLPGSVLSIWAGPRPFAFSIFRAFSVGQVQGPVIKLPNGTDTPC
jgi:hypothetical protein